MDRLDKWTILGITAVTLYGAFLLLTAPEKTPLSAADKQQKEFRQSMISPELDSKIQLVENLITEGSLEKAEALLQGLISEFPYRADLFMLKGDVLMRRQQPIAAMYQYREAIQLNPDLLDRKSKSFQGKKIRVTVDEAMALITTNLQQQPGDSRLKKDRETVYYLLRKLAGSCG